MEKSRKIMKYYKINIFAGEENKKEILVNKETRNRIEVALENGAPRINLGEKGSYNSSQIMSIDDATSEVAEYQRQGIKIDGLLEPAQNPQITGEVKTNRERVGDYLKNTKKSFYEKMGW